MKDCFCLVLEGTFFKNIYLREEMQMSKVPFLNTRIDNLTMAEALDHIDMMVGTRKPASVIPVNVDVITKIEKDNELRKIVDTADLVLADGKPLIWISKLLREPIKEKISGSDLVPKVCDRAAKRGYSVFLLGGEKQVAEEAGKRLERQFPGLRLKGVYSPPVGFEKDYAELASIDRLISAAQPDILVICMGCPKQEKWMAEHFRICGAIVSICAGATVDFLAGRKKRAPRWMSNCGLEWLYRFLQEPRRLFKRYFVDDLAIFKLIWKYRVSIGKKERYGG